MPAFRQVGEKQLPQEVVVMAWSPKRDLIALANRAGEVSAAREGGQPAAPALGRGVNAIYWHIRWAVRSPHYFCNAIQVYVTPLR